MYEGGLRTPMVARWPGRIPVNTTSEAIWSFADFLPTVAALARAKAPKGLDGISVLPELLGQAQQTNDRFLYWEFFERGFQQAARWGNWKVVRPKKEAGLELYNLAKDPGERTDLAKRNPRKAAELRAKLSAWQKQMKAKMPAPNPDYKPTR